MTARAAAFALALLLAPALPAADADTIVYPAARGGGSGSAESSAFASGMNSLTLLVALGLAAAGGWTLWRRRRVPGGSVRTLLAVEETRPLGNRQYLVVASYEGRKFLLGVCPGRIDLLSPLQGEPPRRGGGEASAP